METQHRTNNTTWVRALRSFEHEGEGFRIEAGAVFECDESTARELLRAGVVVRYSGDREL